jgi:hypothetical protein
MARLYVSQAQMDQWTSGGKVDLTDDVMNVPAMKRSFKIEGAVRLIKVVGGTDEAKLVGKVKTAVELAALGGEQYGSSVLLGETAYECEEGFVGVPTDALATSGSGLLDLSR